MDMGIVSVPVVDDDPVELRTEIGLYLPDEIAGECLEVDHLAGILEQDDEQEMMPVIFTTFGEGSVVGAVAGGIEHEPLLAVRLTPSRLR
jgi:hypothetical protein